MSQKVRIATLDDLDRLAGLFDAYRQFYGMAPDRPLARDFLRGRLSRDESMLLIAERPDGEAVGFAQLFPSFSSVRAARIYILNDLYVAEAARCRGVAASLLAAAAEFGRAAGAIELRLATATTNVSAQRVYERMGWTRDVEFHEYVLALDGRAKKARHDDFLVAQLTHFSTMLVVRDLAASEAFYVAHFGFEVVQKLEHLRLLQRPGSSLYLVTEGPPTADKPGVTLAPLQAFDRPPVNLIFHVKDVRATYEVLRGQGLAFLTPPQQPPWGGWRVFAQDPDGYLIEFEQPSQVAIARAGSGE